MEIDDKEQSMIDEMDRLKAASIPVGVMSPDYTDELLELHKKTKHDQIMDKKLKVFKQAAKKIGITKAKIIFGMINQLPEAQTVYRDDDAGIIWFQPDHKKLYKDFHLNQFQYWRLVDQLIKKDDFIFKLKAKEYGKELFTINFIKLDELYDEVEAEEMAKEID